jgi:hypothetical protein
VTIFAGIFLAIFGAAGAWFLHRHYPHARFLRAGYLAMSAAGLLFVVWVLFKVLAIGVAAVAVLAIGAAVGIYGALRKELRIEV